MALNFLVHNNCQQWMNYSDDSPIPEKNETVKKNLIYVHVAFCSQQFSPASNSALFKCINCVIQTNLNGHNVKLIMH